MVRIRSYRGAALSAIRGKPFEPANVTCISCARILLPKGVLRWSWRSFHCARV